MKVYLVVNKSSPHLNHQKIFLDEILADNYIEENQKDLAYKSKLLSKETITLKTELQSGNDKIYYVSDLRDNVFNHENVFFGIKNGKHIVGFYGSIEDAESIAQTIPLVSGRNLTRVDFLEIEDFKLKSNKKLKM